MAVDSRVFYRLVRLSRREYFADFFITPPLTAAAAIMSLRLESPISWLAELLLGWFTWTLYEYALHRWALHKWPILVDIHALHHERQRDYIAVHPLLTLALYAAGWVFVGVGISAGMVGFSLGYVSYSALHTIFHYAREPLRVLASARRRHVRHHRFGNVNFGVSTVFWDRVFGTACGA